MKPTWDWAAKCLDSTAPCQFIPKYQIHTDRALVKSRLSLYTQRDKWANQSA